jgi:glutamine amidotransferase
MSAPTIAVIDYGIGNLRSAEKALQRMGGDACLVTDPADVEGAGAVVLPGVGAFGRCAEALRASGMAGAARDAATDGRPFLGICVGMQLLYEGSEESPGIAGLGVLSGTVVRIPDGVKRPQMQWNQLAARQPGLMLGCEQPWVYFVHSFVAPDNDDVVATCDYGGPLPAAVERGALWATQFHPEKSGTAGLAILGRFVATCPH